VSFFRYPGGKNKLKKEIIEKLLTLNEGPHIHEYREPFWGGGSIGTSLLLDSYIEVDKIWMNDKDIGISSLWTAIIRYPEELQKLIECFQPSVDIFYDLKEKLINIKNMPIEKDDILDIGFSKLAIHQISYSGLGTKSGSPLGGNEQKSKYKIDCRWSPDNMIKKIKKIYCKLSVITVKNNYCTNMGFEDVVKNTDCPSIIYLDPPYYEQGNDLYQCGFSQKNHEDLSEILKESRHSWLLSYDNCEEIRQLYDWAYINELNVNYTIVTDGNSTKKTELLISKEEL
jgi:DNA adenine methylase